MFNVGGGELLVILLVALLVLGPEKLPEAARRVGNVLSELRRMSTGFRQELESALDAHPPARSPQPGKAQPPTGSTELGAPRSPAPPESPSPDQEG